MGQEWTASLPALVMIIVGFGGLAGAILAIVKLWRTIVPDARSQFETDTRRDIHDLHTRVGFLEIEVAKIDQPSIGRRFDGLEGKIDRLYEFLIEQFSAGNKPDRR